MIGVAGGMESGKKRKARARGRERRGGGTGKEGMGETGADG